MVFLGCEDLTRSDESTKPLVRFHPSGYDVMWMPFSQMKAMVVSLTGSCERWNKKQTKKRGGLGKMISERTCLYIVAAVQRLSGIYI